MVVFGDEVTKILHNSLFTFFTEQGKTGKMEFESKENHESKTTKKPKMKLPKFVMSGAFVFISSTKVLLIILVLST